MKERLTIRLTHYEKESIKFLVSEGKYESSSAFVRQAIKAMLAIEKPGVCDVDAESQEERAASS